MVRSSHVNRENEVCKVAGSQAEISDWHALLQHVQGAENFARDRRLRIYTYSLAAYARQ